MYINTTPVIYHISLVTSHMIQRIRERKLLYIIITKTGKYSNIDIRLIYISSSKIPVLMLDRYGNLTFHVLYKNQNILESLNSGLFHRREITKTTSNKKKKVK